ncbi:PLP-dependent aminotransferase family protein [Gracilibacillus caseinilyticus]|uniref:PLP-dependent aminotransferase family protein n=1 Tax=Gracilibacillus caseinilyticus TaxID=2932256 RepID=A0ABY4F7S1_9BACI|nr:PLP-dependent aminotransferase family protein [Gracilibacillus caseinilyticus]UOQ50501.1 PLP-dependent aminotransferase family protein [Gracilibacillus caseinilyticus]
MKYGFSDRVKYLKSSAVRDILKIINQGNIISFAGGLPEEKLFPVEAVDQAFHKAITTNKKALQYGETEGVPELRALLSERMIQKGLHRSPDDILITSGSQQAIDLFSRVMFNAGDVILTENPTYLAALQVFESYETNVVAVESDDDGMVLADLEEKIIKHKPKCIYVVPTYSNPTGKVWSLERRKKLLELANQYHIVIFEDDPYGELKFDEQEAQPSIASLDEDGLVLYTSTFSKTVVPAVRIGWIVGPHQIIRIMAQAKQASDLHTNSISQHALVHLLKEFDIDGHIQTIRKTYYERMLIMKRLLDSVDIEGLEYIVPKGGMFFWVKLPPHINTTTLLNEAVAAGVAFVPGAPFYVSDPEENTFRLNFTNSEPALIEEGMKRLVNVLESATVNV